jgi:hypothetical protein
VVSWWAAKESRKQPEVWESRDASQHFQVRLRVLRVGSSPAWLCRLEKSHKTHTKPQNNNTLPGLLEVMGELTCL